MASAPSLQVFQGKTRVLCVKPQGLGPVSQSDNNTPNSPAGFRRGAPSRPNTQVACFSIPMADIQVWVEEEQLREGKGTDPESVCYKVFTPNTKQQGVLSLVSTKGPSVHA